MVESTDGWPARRKWVMNENVIVGSQETKVCLDFDTKTDSMF